METKHVGLESSKKRRKRAERTFRFKSFCEPGHPATFHGTSFQENIKVLLGFGHPESIIHKGMKCWSFQLELHHYPSTYVRLFVAEEAVGMSLYRQCHYCRSVGWGHHVICNKRFHFVLPSNGTTPTMERLSIEISGKGLNKAAISCKPSDSQGHLMHGVLHCNGFGHLVCINGIEGGSEFISGHQILDLWDRICTSLQLRKVSISDVAKKWSMELRLIHGIAYAQPWFGHWGYKFGHGSYGVTEHMYQASLEALRALPLFLLAPHFTCTCHEIPVIIAKYQTISGHALLTLGDLVHFMVELNRRLPPNSPTAMDYHGIITEATCRWSMKRVEMAAQVIVEALKKYEFRWVTRQEVRDAARAYIGDTGLLDYVLKSLGNHIVGNYIVRRMVNPVTKVLEYCLQDICSIFPSHSGRFGSTRFQFTRVQLMKDLRYLYKNILREQSPAIATGVFARIPMAVRVILDTKHLVKDYNGGVPQENDLASKELLKLVCTVRLIGGQEPEKLPPNEVLVLQANATIGDLKREVERKFKDMYWGLKNFVADKVVGVDGEDCELVLGMVEQEARVVVEGRVGEKDEGEIFEGGDVGSLVDCLCGAKEADGEPMVCCDICEIWQHTRCARMVDGDVVDEEIPRVFLCNRCENNILALPSIHY